MKRTPKKTALPRVALNNRKLLYGGTFNPIHNGHLASVLRLKEHLNAELIIIPNGTPPHRETPDTSIEDRVEMLKLAFAQTEDITISDHEQGQTGPAYFFNTLEHFRAPDLEIHALIGSDQANAFRTWYRWKELLQMAVFHVIPRGEPLAEILDFTIFPFPVLPISSSMIRERAAEGRSISGLVPQAVEKYILRKGLYER